MPTIFNDSFVLVYIYIYILSLQIDELFGCKFQKRFSNRLYKLTANGVNDTSRTNPQIRRGIVQRQQHFDVIRNRAKIFS